MAKRSGKTQLDTRVLDGILKQAEPNARDAVMKAAFSIEAHAKVNIQQMDAIDTGALLNSVYTSVQGQSNGQAAMSQAQALNPDAETVPLPVPNGPLKAHIGPSMEYSADVHFGTDTMPGRPYLLDAVTQVEREFAGMFKKVVTNK